MTDHPHTRRCPFCGLWLLAATFNGGPRWGRTPPHLRPGTRRRCPADTAIPPHPEGRPA